MTLELVEKDDCSSIENCGTRKLDRRDKYKLMVEKKLKCRKEFKSEFKDVSGRPEVYVDPKLGIIRIRKASYQAGGYYSGWSFRFYKNDKKEFDHIECHCLDENGNSIKTYIIPRDAIKTNHFMISDIRCRKQQKIVKKWYDKYEKHEPEGIGFITILGIMPDEKEDRLKELGKIYGFETDQQHSVRILNKMIDDIEKEIDNDEKCLLKD